MTTSEQRLLAHIYAARTRWSRVSKRLLDFGLRGVPLHRTSRNPVKWIAAQTGMYMSEFQTRRITQQLEKEES